MRDDRLTFSAYLASRPAKDYFFRYAKQTTGIASINMTQLRITPIYIRPYENNNVFEPRSQNQ